MVLKRHTFFCFAVLLKSISSISLTEVKQQQFSLAQRARGVSEPTPPESFRTRPKTSHKKASRNESNKPCDKLSPREDGPERCYRVTHLRFCSWWHGLLSSLTTPAFPFPPIRAGSSSQSSFGSQAPSLSFRIMQRTQIPANSGIKDRAKRKGKPHLPMNC